MFAGLYGAATILSIYDGLSYGSVIPIRAASKILYLSLYPLSLGIQRRSVIEKALEETNCG